METGVKIMCVVWAVLALFCIVPGFFTPLWMGIPLFVFGGINLSVIITLIRGALQSKKQK